MFTEPKCFLTFKAQALLNQFQQSCNFKTHTRRGLEFPELRAKGKTERSKIKKHDFKTQLRVVSKIKRTEQNRKQKYSIYQPTMREKDKYKWKQHVNKGGEEMK